MLQSNVQALKRNLKHLCDQLAAFANHGLTPGIMGVRDLRDALSAVTDALETHPGLKLLVGHATRDVWGYYGMMQIDCFTKASFSP